MAPEKSIQLKQNTILVMTASTFLTVVGAVFWFGQQVERTKARLEASVTIYELDQWERKTERLNPGWLGAGALDLRRGISPNVAKE